MRSGQRDAQLLLARPLPDDWGIGGEHEVDAGVGDQVRLELG
jgi:hypothetical protein